MVWLDDLTRVFNKIGLDQSARGGVHSDGREGEVLCRPRVLLGGGDVKDVFVNRGNQSIFLGLGQE